MKALLLLLAPLLVFASQVLSYNIYERSDRADVMITFDTPFSGRIKQSIGDKTILIKLEGASIESSKIKRVNSEFLHSLTITPLDGQIQILAHVAENTKLIASKTSDAYGLRLRFKNKGSTTKKSDSNEPTTDLSALPTKKGAEFSRSYYIVVGILIVGIIILLVLKKRMLNNPIKKKQNSWLFDQTNTQENESSSPSILQPNNSTNEVSIRFQKSIDSSNNVVMLDFGEESYLVLMGNSNILLDKFKENQPTSQQEFDAILQERNQELEDFLGSSPKKESIYSTTEEPLQAYKERAGVLAYNEEA